MKRRNHEVLESLWAFLVTDGISIRNRITNSARQRSAAAAAAAATSSQAFPLQGRRRCVAGARYDGGDHAAVDDNLAKLR